MHELSLAQSIIDLVEQTAARERFVRVRRLGLDIGKLACVEVDALQTAFASASRGTCAEGAQLDIVEIAGQGECSACGLRAPMPSLYELCPQCGERPLSVIQGTEMRVRDLDVE